MRKHVLQRHEPAVLHLNRRLILRQHLYFCTSTARKLSTCITTSISASSVSGLQLLVYEASCKRPEATGVKGLKLLVYEALIYWCKRPQATCITTSISASSVSGLQLLVYEAASY
jgi:hypothetical protein